MRVVADEREHGETQCKCAVHAMVCSLLASKELYLSDCMHRSGSICYICNKSLQEEEGIC
jgi:hypothetical protein